MYRIKLTEIFQKKFNNLIPLNMQKSVWKRINKLSENPYIGKPLGNRFNRELKMGKFRIYFSVYEEYVTILLLNVSDKKEQQESIDEIRRYRDIYMEFVKNLKDD